MISEHDHALPLSLPPLAKTPCGEKLTDPVRKESRILDHLPIPSNTISPQPGDQEISVLLSPLSCLHLYRALGMKVPGALVRGHNTSSKRVSPCYQGKKK